MWEARGRWSRADKDLFVIRCIEGAVWVGAGGNTQLIDTDDEMAELNRLFPALKGVPLEAGTVRGIGDRFKANYPNLAKKAKSSRKPKSDFRSHPSPSALLEENFSFPKGGKLSADQWRQVLRIIQEGVQWERRHPELDYGLARRGDFMKLVRQRYAGIRVKDSLTGIHVRDLDAAIRTYGANR